MNCSERKKNIEIDKLHGVDAGEKCERESRKAGLIEEWS